jgi:O-succinylhomoserine sulfhydrylase
MHKFHPQTLAIREQAQRSGNREHSAPIYFTSSFVFDDAEQARALFADEIEGNIYTRFSNPNNSEFIRKVCLLEGADDGIAVASGMSAVFTSIAALLKSGDHIVASRSVFGSSHQILTMILPKWGITHTYVDIENNSQWEQAIQPNTRMLFVETPSNPSLDIADLKFLGGLADKYALILNVDNCFATPCIQQPIPFGAHLVTHSATKYMDGQGRAIGGIIVGNKDLIKDVRFFARHTGPSLSPFNAWLLSKSLETLSLRMERHCSNAWSLATRLQAGEGLSWVKYPFLDTHPQQVLAKSQMSAGGGIVTFEVKGGYERAKEFINALQMISHTANLGDARSIATHPASTTHSRLSAPEQLAVGITPGLIRISCGLEHIEDIIWDVEQAIRA